MSEALKSEYGDVLNQWMKVELGEVALRSAMVLLDEVIGC